MPSPQFQKLLDSLGQSSANTEASRDEIIAAYRQQMSDCLVIDGVAPSIAKTTKAEKVLAGEVPSEWVLAEGADPDLRIMYIHGGGFMAGTLDGYRHVVEALSRASGMAVLAIDYPPGAGKSLPRRIGRLCRSLDLDAHPWPNGRGRAESRIPGRRFGGWPPRIGADATLEG